MAWYRAGVGGIPSSLKTDMNNVLNKKFGTSTTYAPDTWAPNVNLMGPLPEKTVSGAIVSFSDGADDVPLKKCEITLPASLVGYSSVDVHHTGSNVWDEATELGAINVVNGQNVANNNFIRSTNYIPVLPNTVYYKCAPQNILQLYYGKDKTYLSYGSWNKNTTFTTPANCYFVRFYVAQEYGTTYNHDIALNYPVSVTDYASYSGTTHTAQLGRTIYGGTADVVNGQGTDSGVKYTLDGTQAVTMLSTTDPNVKRFSVSIPNDSITTTTDRDDIVSDNLSLPTVTNAITSAGGKGINYRLNGSHNIIVCFGSDVSLTSEAEFNTYVSEHNIEIVYTLANPSAFTFDSVPIDSKLGNNTIWSEQGSAEVTYRADINLALGGQ